MTVDELSAIDRKIKALVGDVNNLPTPPVVFAQISRVIDDENASAYDIAGILSEDPAMSAKVLRLSNSAFYGFSNPVPTVKQAIVVLGFNEVKNVVLSASALSAFKKSSRNQEDEDIFWRHSLAVAVISRMLTRTRRVDRLLQAETAFSAGLLHDIGKMVVSCYAPAEFQKIRELQAKQPLPDILAEDEVMGFNHTHIGTFLGQHWNLPSELLDTIMYHHSPGLADDSSLYAAVINLADYLAYTTFDEESSPAPPEAGTISKVGIPEEDFEQLKIPIIEEYAKSQTFLQMALA